MEVFDASTAALLRASFVFETAKFAHLLWQFSPANFDCSLSVVFVAVARILMTPANFDSVGDARVIEMTSLQSH